MVETAPGRTAVDGAASWVSVDGVVSPAPEARISAIDRGFLSGDGCFETLRAYSGCPFALEAHLERLGVAMSRLGLEIPPGMLQRIATEVRALVDRLGARDAVVRVTVSRGAAAHGGWNEAPRGPTCVVWVAPLPAIDPNDTHRGVSVTTVECAHFGAFGGAQTGLKSTSYAPYARALATARTAGAFEVLRVAEHGEILEGVTSNVFVIDRAGALVTPPVVRGVLPGVTRSHVIALARSLGLEVRERLLFAPDVYRASEVLLTNALREVVPVVRVDGVVIGDGSPGPWARRLSVGYSALVAMAAQLPPNR